MKVAPAYLHLLLDYLLLTGWAIASRLLPVSLLSDDDQLSYHSWKLCDGYDLA